MMVATALPAAAPQATKAPAAAASTPADAAEGGFSGTLLQLLGLAPAAEAVPAASPVAQAILEALDQDQDAPAGTPLLPALPFIPPGELKLPGLQGETTPGEGTQILVATGTAGTALAALSAEDIAQALKTLLQDAAEAPSSPSESLPQLAQPAQLATVADAAGIGRSPGAEASLPRHVHAEVGTPAWPDELGARLTLMAEKGNQAASLRLSPEHLGPLEVQISVQDGEASVWFGAANADTRAALEQALPRLRELFAAQGMSLAQTGVSQESPRDPGQPVTTRGTAGMAGENTEAEAPVIAAATRRGLVDTWA